MNLFRPREIRAVLILSALVFMGSSLTLLKRQGKLSSLDLDIFLENNRYNYSYGTKDIPRENKNADSQINREVIESLDEDPGQMEIIDLNTADYFELQRLPGVGPVLAGRILAYRDSVGAFQSIDQLLNISGIGQKKFAQIKSRVVIK